MLRTIRTNATNLDFTLDFGSIRIEAGTSQYVEIDLSTRDADDSESARIIRDTTFRERADSVVVAVPERSDQFGSISGVTFTRDGIQVTNVRDNMSIVGNRVFINGVEVRPGSRSSETVHGIEVTIRMPRLATAQFNAKDCDLVHVGDPLGRVDFEAQSGSANLRDVASIYFNSQSGSLNVQNTHTVRARTQSGSVFIRTAESASVNSQSGSIEILGLSGDADAHTMSGNVRVTALTAGSVCAYSMSGNVTISDPNLLHRRGLSVDMSSMSGRTRLI